MSLSRIPLNQVFRAKADSTSSNGSRPDFDVLEPRDVTNSPTPSDFSEPVDITPKDVTAPSRVFPSLPSIFTRPKAAPNMASSSPVLNGNGAMNGNGVSNGGPVRGNRNPKMLEYERQAEERMREQDRMEEERNRMANEQSRMRQEQERIAQEQYEMDQYYEAEALKHAEEMRIHQEEVRRHQERVREHERKLRDHEESSMAFAS